MTRTTSSAAAVCFGVLLMALSGCAVGGSDEQRAAKYEAAVASLPHVADVESTYSTAAGMGRTADVFIHADTDDQAELSALFEEAFPAVVAAAEGDPDVSLAIQVISADGEYAVNPEDYGYDGTGTLDSYREFLEEHPEF